MLQLGLFHKLVDVLQNVSIVLVSDIWTIEMSIDEGKYSSKTTDIHQFELDIKLNPHDWHKTLCLNQDEASSHR